MGLLILLTIFSLAQVCFGDKSTSSCIENIIIEPVTNPVIHAEEPHWDVRDNCLYYVDIVGREVLKYDPSTKKVTSLKLVGGDVSPIIPTRTPNNFIVGVGRLLCHIKWDGKNSTYRHAQINVLDEIDTEAGKVNNRFNDGKADSSGRIWAGTIGPETNKVVLPNLASLYQFSKNNSTKVLLSPVTNSNGLVWTQDDEQFYYIDTPTKKIAGFDYDPETGSICNERTVFDLEANNITGLPDGMTMDTNGNLWIALFLGGSVIKVDPSTGTFLQRVALPVSQVSSVAFGGENLDVLYVTTSKSGLAPKVLAKEPLAGSVFAIRNLGVRGFPQNLADF